MKTRATFPSPRVGRVVPNAPARHETPISMTPQARSHRRVGDNAPYLASFGFTLIELIGVMAILAILAAVIAPNILQSVDAAAVRAERETARNLATAVENFVRRNRVLPTEENPAVVLPALPAWASEIGSSAGLSVTDVAFNRRSQRRVYLIDPAPPRRRVIILSAMDNQLVAPPAEPLPRQLNINTAARFDQIWTTPDGAVPPNSNWAGWAPWNARARGSFLVIQRLNLDNVFRTDLKNLRVALSNQGPTPTHFRVLYAGTVTPGAWMALPSASSAILEAASGYDLYPGDQIDLSAAAVVNAATVPNYRHILRSSDTSFVFKDGIWQISP
jgi:prepilin-type N-terminal cleavage/methylation domain-containing protein